MLGIFITLFTFVLILISLFMMLVVLMQRANTNAGMGAAFGGGVADSAFGADTTNVLTRTTRWVAVAFFVVAAALYLMYIAQASDRATTDDALPAIPVQTFPETETPATSNMPAVDSADGLPMMEETLPAGE